MPLRRTPAPRTCRSTGPARHATLFLALLFVAWPAASSGQVLEGSIIREIRIAGLRHTRETIVREQLLSEVGQRYQAERTVHDIERLDRLGVFSAIDIRPVPLVDGVALEVQVIETLPFLAYPSMDSNEENGLSAGGGLKWANFLGRAVTLSGKARFGNATTINLEIEGPWRTRMPWWYRFEFDQHFRPNSFDDFQEHSSELDMRIGRQIGQRWMIGVRGGFTAIESDIEGVTLSPSNRDHSPGLGVFVRHDTRDLYSNPHRGWWNEFEIGQHSGFLGGDGGYLRAELDIRRFQPLGRRHTLGFFSLTTLRRGEVGTDIPTYLLLHIGGANTIRGWDLNARRGKNQSIHTLEYRFEILRPKSWSVAGLRFYTGIHLAAFADAGTAWTHGDEFNRNFIGGGGFGIRVVMPFLKLLRFDFGFGGPGSLKFHFGILDKAERQRKRIR